LDASAGAIDRIRLTEEIMQEMEMEEPLDHNDPDEEGDPNDELGLERGMDTAVDDSDDDVLDDFINKIMDMVAVNYEDDSAEEAVYDAIAGLIDDSSIDDMPEKDSGDDVKMQWIWNSLPKIKERLHAMGIEYDPTDLQHYETFSHTAL